MSSLVTKPWVFSAACFFVGVLIGIWTDSILKIQKRKPSYTERLADRCASLAFHINGQLQGALYAPGRRGHVAPATVSEYEILAAELRDLGIPFPYIDEDEDVSEQMAFISIKLERAAPYLRLSSRREIKKALKDEQKPSQ